MLVYEDETDKTKCLPQNDEFTGYENETLNVRQSLNSKGIIANVSMESAGLPEYNPSSEKLALYQVKKVSRNNFLGDSNGTFYVEVEHKFTAKKVNVNSNDACFSILFPNCVVVLATNIGVPSDINMACKSKLCVPMCCGKS